MKLKDYLLQYHTEQTSNSYEREIIKYMTSFGVDKTKNSDYSDVMGYIEILRKKYSNPQTIVRIISAIKRYYDYLVVQGIRKDNPAKFIILKDKISRDVQLQDLFKSEELELLLTVKERYGILRNRNRLIVSLLIYQGLCSEEILQLEKEDLDMDKGEIRLKGTHSLNPRNLKLKPNQIMMFWKYWYEDRPKLKGEEDSLFKGLRGSLTTVDSVHYLIERGKYMFPESQLCPRTVRQSVIRNLLKSGKDLRVVQVFAGHKYISSTERYREKDIENLQHQVLKYHPLG